MSDYRSRISPLTLYVIALTLGLLLGFVLGVNYAYGYESKCEVISETPYCEIIEWLIL